MGMLRLSPRDQLLVWGNSVGPFQPSDWLALSVG
jgi:hypothetical protein